jgi:riboflavin-specific deaminase-like protein
MKTNSLKTSRAKRPFVFINMAMTADGKISTANRAVSSFGSKRDLEHLYELRTTADAVMAGARTLDLNEVFLGSGGNRFNRMRLRNRLSKYSLRIIVSGSGSINPNAAIFQRRISPIILLTTERASQAKLRRLLHLVSDVLVCGKNEVDFAHALPWLREKWKVRRLLCEGGGELNSALFRAGLVDELHLTVCPKVFGGSSAPTIAEGEGIRHLADAVQLDLKSMHREGDELFLVYPAKPREARC